LENPLTKTTAYSHQQGAGAGGDYTVQKPTYNGRGIKSLGISLAVLGPLCLAQLTGVPFYRQ